MPSEGVGRLQARGVEAMPGLLEAAAHAARQAHRPALRDDSLDLRVQGLELGERGGPALAGNLFLDPGAGRRCALKPPLVLQDALPVGKGPAVLGSRGVGPAAVAALQQAAAAGAGPRGIVAEGELASTGLGMLNLAHVEPPEHLELESERPGQALVLPLPQEHVPAGNATAVAAAVAREAERTDSIQPGVPPAGTFGRVCAGARGGHWRRRLRIARRLRGAGAAVPRARSSSPRPSR